jgi:transposase
MREDERMEIRQLYEAGVSISELARRFGHDRKTIRTALTSSPEGKQDARASRRERKKGSKLEPYKHYVKQRM